MTCDTATTLKNAVDRLSKVKHVLGGEKSLINGTWSMPMFCSATTGYFTIPSDPKATSNAIKYRLGYSPDRRPEAAKAQLNWDNLNLHGTHYHYPLTDGKDLLTLAAFNQDAAAWRPETIIRRGELPGGFRTCVDWRFIGGIPPVANGKVRIRSRRRSINFKRHSQRGSTCLFTGFRNAVAVSRCAQLGELAREPLLGNVAYQEMIMYTTVDNGPSNVPLRTYINVYRTVDNTSNYVWLNTYDPKKGNISCIPQNKDSPALTYVQVKSDPTTKAILNKDYYLDTDQHKYVYEADLPDSTTASRAFTAHTLPSCLL